MRTDGDQSSSRVSSAQNGLFCDDLLREIRSRFDYVDSDPLTPKRIFFDSASGSLRLKDMTAALASQTRWPDQLGRVTPGSRRTGDIVSRGLEDVHLFLGAKAGTVMSAMSGTHAIFRAVNAALASSQRGNVVTTNLEHPSVYDSTRYFAGTYDMEWRVAQVNPETGAVPTEAILRHVDRNTRLIGIVHGSNITGAVHDLKTITREARKINPAVFVLADGVQYAPHAPVDVDDLDVDAYVFCPYKAFCVKGIGFAYLSDRLADQKHWALRGKAPDDWLLGSAEDATYAAWSAVLDYVSWLGSHFTDSTDRRAQIVAGMAASKGHLVALLQRLIHGSDRTPGLGHMGHVRMIGMSGDLRHRLCQCFFGIDRINSYQGVELFRRANVCVQNRVPDAYSKHALDALGVAEGVRLSACHYNTPHEIDTFLHTAASLAELTDQEIALVPSKQDVRGQGEG